MLLMVMVFPHLFVGPIRLTWVLMPTAVFGKVTGFCETVTQLCAAVNFGTKPQKLSSTATPMGHRCPKHLCNMGFETATILGSNSNQHKIPGTLASNEFKVNVPFVLKGRDFRSESLLPALRN